MATHAQLIVRPAEIAILAAITLVGRRWRSVAQCRFLHPPFGDVYASIARAGRYAIVEP